MNIKELPDEILQIIYKKSKKHIMIDQLNGINYCFLFDTCKYFYKFRIVKETTFDWTSGNWLFLDY